VVREVVRVAVRDIIKGVVSGMVCMEHGVFDNPSVTRTPDQSL
jgi:hypothetical protein